MKGSMGFPQEQSGTPAEGKPDLIRRLEQFVREGRSSK